MMEPPRSAHVGHGVAAGAERAGQVHGDELVPLVERWFVGERLAGAGRDAGDVGEDVDAAELVQAGGDQLGAVGVVGDRAAAGHGAAAALGVDRGDHRVEGPAVGAAPPGAVHHDVGALGGHPAGSRLADAAAGARDDGVEPGERAIGVGQGWCLLVSPMIGSVIAQRGSRSRPGIDTGPS